MATDAKCQIKQRPQLVRPLNLKTLMPNQALKTGSGSGSDSDSESDSFLGTVSGSGQFQTMSHGPGAVKPKTKTQTQTKNLKKSTRKRNTKVCTNFQEITTQCCG